MKKIKAKTFLALCLMIILSTILLSGCSGAFEPEKMAERTAVILNKLWEYSTRFFKTLMENLVCINGLLVISGFSGFAIWNRLK
jgi:hypothetical protein